MHCSRSLFLARLSAIAPALLYLLYPYSRTDPFLGIVPPTLTSMDGGNAKELFGTILAM